MFKSQSSKYKKPMTEQQALLKPEQMNPDTSPALLCEGTIRIGWVQAATLRPARIPGSLLERLSS